MAHFRLFDTLPWAFDSDDVLRETTGSTWLNPELVCRIEAATPEITCVWHNGGYCHVALPHAEVVRLLEES